MKTRLTLLCVLVSVFFLISCDLFFTNVTGFLEIESSPKEVAFVRVFDGLVFELQDDGTFSLSGIDTSVNSVFVIPESVDGIKVSKISDGAFLNNKDIKEVIIPASIHTIGDNAFKGAQNLQNVSIANGVQSIGSNAFASIDLIDSIIIPGSVSFVGDNAFENSNIDVFIDFPDSSARSWSLLWDTSVNQQYQWASWHEVSFNSKGGSLVSSQAVLTSDNIIKKLPTPVREGKSFEGWYLGEDYKNKFTENVSRVGADITLIAKWE